MKFAFYFQECMLSSDNSFVSQVWYPDVDKFRQIIFYDKDTMSVTCACKLYTKWVFCAPIAPRVKYKLCLDYCGTIYIE